MSDSHEIEDVAVHNERSLKKLAWAIEASVGQFKLFLARCNYTSLRSRLVERLQELTSVEIRILELKTSEKTLYARIQAELDSEQPDALMVFGLESVGDLDELLSATNQVREEFRKNFHFPLVLWVNDEVLKKLLQLAPDFESWATTTDFTLTTHELVGFLRERAEWFFEENLALTLSGCWEIRLACQDLQSREQELGLELKATLESLLGFVESIDYANRNLDTALYHYQKGLQLWQQSNNLERQGKLLRDITFCYYLKALRYREIDHPDWQATGHYLRQSLKVFAAAQRPDLVANSILSFGRVLRRLQDWDQLQILAQKALQQHQTQNRPIELAQDYGFLAEVALAKKRWVEAKALAQKALDVLSAVPSVQSANSSGAVYKLPDKSVISYDPSRYRFILGQAQQHLDQHQEAIRNLEAAKRIGSPEHDTQLYLDILCHLQKLYFEQKDYLKAFDLKLERQSIEQQYGLRAFVGAGRIQPQRQAKFAPTQVKSPETIAPEITASGRQLDVERLVQRIGEPSYKLIVIHGQSGVGKSSLVNGGLLPALKQKAIGTSDVLPVPMRVYTSWVGELGKLLAEALLEKGIDLPTPLDSQAAILEHLQQSESRHLRTVLIFDQFEEFFFVYPDAGERRQFFEFLGACLNILPVKVILSLREDYLHYLLECDRLPSMKMIGNDILTRNVRYPLGNFSSEDAKAIIERLTERSSFYLEPGLIEELVQDLAGNLGEVRPIELQIVGAQLQTDNVTTLAEYQKRGHKEELVKRYLAEVVEDCGDENKQAAELVLYLLTDEKGTRPLKTRAELERDLKALAADLTTEVSKLDLVLQIFVDSGMVLLLPELPTDRYQLVHDYLAAFIRQQQEPRLNELIAELQKERKQRQKAETQHQLTEEELKRAEQARQILAKANQKAGRRIRIGSAVLLAAIAALIWAGKVVGNAQAQRQEANTRAEVAKREESQAKAKLETTNREAVQANQNLKAAQGKLTVANQQVQQIKQEVEQAKKAKQEAEATTQQVNQNLKTVQNNLIAANQQAQQAEQAAVQAKQTKQEAETRTQQANQNLKAAQEKLTAANQQVQQTKQEVANAKVELARIDQQAKQQLQAATQKVNVAVEQKEKAQQAAAEAKRVEERLQEEAEKARQELAQRATELKNVNEQLNLLNRVEDDLAASIKDTLTKIEQQTKQKPAVIYLTLGTTDQQSDDARLGLWLVTAKTQQQQQIATTTREQVLQVAKNFRQQVTYRSSRNSYLVPSQKLYEWMIQPLEAELQRQGINNLVFLTDNELLRSIPFAALYDGKSFLVEKYSIGLMPGLTLTDNRYVNIKNASVLAIGISKGLEGFSPLPAVPIELSTITNLWSGKSFLNEQSTLENLKLQRKQNPFQIIHLATHAMTSASSSNPPLRTGLTLQDSSNNYLQLWDTKLGINQFEQLGWDNPPVELLVLSSCRTGGGAGYKFGMAGAAIQTGVKSVIGSLWYVDDTGTMAMMAEFYSQLRTAPIKAEALRQAQLAMLRGQLRIEGDRLRTSSRSFPLPPELAQGEKPELSQGKESKLAHPYYWSGFTMIGNPW